MDISMRTFALSVAVLLLSVCAHSQPRIFVVGGTTFSIGSIPRGKVVDHELTLQNPGNDTLVISRVDVSCGCTGSMLSRDHIPPGGSGTLQITFNSKNFHGPIHKTVTVNSNAPADPAVQIAFEGDVVQEVVYTPEFLWFQDVAVGSRATKTIAIKNEGKTDFRLTGYSTGVAGVNINLPVGDIHPGDSVAVPVEFVPPKSGPMIADRIVIRTSHPSQPEITIGFYGNIRTESKK